MGILARLFGNNNALSDVNLLDGNVPTKDQFVIEEPITDSVPDQSCVESQLGAYDRVVELSEVSHYDEAVFEVYHNKGTVNLDSKLKELKLVFKNAAFESIDFLEDKILELDQYEALCNSHDQYEQALECVRKRTNIERKVARLKQAYTDADSGQGMISGIIESYKRGYFFAKGQLLNSIEG